jgi:hypothetical protein
VSFWRFVAGTVSSRKSSALRLRPGARFADQ